MFTRHCRRLDRWTKVCWLRMLKGIATRNYEACAEAVPEAFWSVILIGVPSLRERHGSKAG